MNRFSKLIVWIMTLLLIFAIYPTMQSSVTLVTGIYGNGNFLIPILPLILLLVDLIAGAWWVFKGGD